MRCSSSLPLSTFALLLLACATGGTPAESSTTGTGGSTGTSSTAATTGAGGAGGAGGGAGGMTGTGGGGAIGPCGAVTCTGDIEWVRRYGPNPGQQFAFGLGVNALGQPTIAGSYNATIDLGGNVLVTSGGIDMFFSRVDANGGTLLAKSFGSPGNEIPLGARSDRKGNSVFYGVFQGNLDFGNGPLQAQNFRMFVARLDPMGNAVWSKAFGDKVNAVNMSAGFDQSGNVVLGAGYPDTEIIDFGAGPVQGGPTTFVVTRFTGAGGALWTKKLVSSMASPFALDGIDGMVIAGDGDVSSPPDIGCGSPAGTYRYFGRLDENGACAWSKGVTGGAIDFISAEKDAIAVMGRFNGSVTIGADTIAAPGGKRFVLRYDTGGKLLWSFLIADDSVNLEAIAVDAHGGVVFKGALANGAADLAGHPVQGDSFLARLGPDGAFLWAKGFQGNASFPSFVDVAPSGHVFLYGNADGPIDLGGGVLSGGTGANADVVLAKFKP